MIGGGIQSAIATVLLAPVSAADTAAATSGWVDVRDAEGDVVFIVHGGALTGSLSWIIEDATDGTGTGAAELATNEGAFAAGAAGQVQKRTVNASATRGWVRCVGTVVTGPALLAATLLKLPKYV